MTTRSETQPSVALPLGTASSQQPSKHFFGWRVAGGAVVLAFFGWGVGFYGPPVFLHAVVERTGWSVALVSSAVTLHFLVGALVGANLPKLHRRFGIPAVTKACALAMALGIVGWALARAPWQLFGACLLTGFGWSGMSAAALNQIVSPWFDRGRPAALGMAYNGASVGGVVFSPLWVASIGFIGFVNATLAVGCVMAVVLWLLAGRLFSRTPESMGVGPDGEARRVATTMGTASTPSLAGALMWRDRRFRTLAAGMALGLFAQIGLVAHLYSLLVPALGRQAAGFAVALITVMAIGGRLLTGYLMGPAVDRRLVAGVGYGAQLLGSLAFLAAGGVDVALLALGIMLFGVGFGNATSLPPLIAQKEFAKADVARAVALVVAIAQASFAFAPAAFGWLRDVTISPDAGGSAPGVFVAAAICQALAIIAFWARRAP